MLPPATARVIGQPHDVRKGPSEGQKKAAASMLKTRDELFRVLPQPTKIRQEPIDHHPSYCRKVRWGTPHLHQSAGHAGYWCGDTREVAHDPRCFWRSKNVCEEPIP